MADETTAGTHRAKAPILPMLVSLLNSVAILGTVGFAFYFKFIYKHPTFTESTERAHLQGLNPQVEQDQAPTFISFDPVTVNIASTPERPSAADGTFKQIQGKLHYATVGLTLEIRDKNQQPVIEKLRPYILDKLVQSLGKKQFHELTNIQGRYLLMSELVDFSNHIAIARASNGKPLVTNGYFTQFLVQ